MRSLKDIANDIGNFRKQIATLRGILDGWANEVESETVHVANTVQISAGATEPKLEVFGNAVIAGSDLAKVKLL